MTSLGYRFPCQLLLSLQATISLQSGTYHLRYSYNWGNSEVALCHFQSMSVLCMGLVYGYAALSTETESTVPHDQVHLL